MSLITDLARLATLAAANPRVVEALVGQLTRALERGDHVVVVARARDLDDTLDEPPEGT